MSLLHLGKYAVSWSLCGCEDELSEKLHLQVLKASIEKRRSQLVTCKVFPLLVCVCIYMYVCYTENSVRFITTLPYLFLHDVWCV